MRRTLVLAAALACAGAAITTTVCVRERSAPGAVRFFPLTAKDQTSAEENLRRKPVSPREAKAARLAVNRECRLGERWKLHHRFGFPDGAVVEFSNRPRRRGE